jgi:signal transduction histidine kinase
MDKEFFSEANKIGLIVLGSIFLLFFMAVLLLLFFYFSKKRIVQKEIEHKNIEIAYQKELLEAEIKTQESERERIARDLHDEISSKLNIISLNCHILNSNELSSTQSSEINQSIINLVEITLQSARRIAHDLLPPVLEKFGLHAGIEELCYDFNQSKKVAINYHNEIDFETVDKNKHLHIFRILQELINNSLRHGKATQINISFEKSEQQTICFYEDNGIGINISEFQNKKGLGMKNIESRVIFLKGQLNLKSDTNQGFKATLNF